jgi:DNA-3-methyladenine glycosylase II
MVAFRVEPEGSPSGPAARVSVARPDDLPVAVAAVERMFVTADLTDLTRRDPLVAALDRRFRGVRPVLQLDVLPSLVRSISAQQINLRWAGVIRARLAERYGERHLLGDEEVWSLDAERLAAATVAELRALQLTERKSASVIAVARATLGKGLTMADLAALSDEGVIERLVALPGIGLWSAEWFLARTLGRPRVVAGDLGVRKAVGVAYFDGAMPSEEEVRRATAHWGEAAGVAQQLLLHASAEGLGTRAPMSRLCKRSPQGRTGVVRSS